MLSTRNGVAHQSGILGHCQAFPPLADLGPLYVDSLSLSYLSSDRGKKNSGIDLAYWALITVSHSTADKKWSEKKKPS